MITNLLENNRGNQLKQSTYRWMNSVKAITVTLQTQFLVQERLTESEFLHANLEMYWKK